MASMRTAPAGASGAWSAWDRTSAVEPSQWTSQSYRQSGSAIMRAVR